MTNLYNILDVDKTAPKETIKKSYRNKSKKAHPDAGGKTEDFQLITTAYKILTDDEKRARYDAGEKVDDILKAVLTKENKIQTILAQMFAEIVPMIEPKTTSVIDLMKTNLDATIKQAELVIKNEKEKVRKFEAVVKRLKSKKNNKLFHDIASSQLLALNKNVSLVEEKKKDCQDALEFLKDFSYEVDSAEVINVFGGGGYTPFGFGFTSTG